MIIGPLHDVRLDSGQQEYISSSVAEWKATYQEVQQCFRECQAVGQSTMIIIGKGHKAICNVKTSTQELGHNTPHMLILVNVVTTVTIGEEHGMLYVLGLPRTESSVGHNANRHGALRPDSD